MNEDLAIYFLHLRKTAGTSLTKTIENSSNCPQSVSIINRRDYFLAACLSPKNRFQGSVLRTHSYYGIHRSNPRHLMNLSPYTYITILREPIDRAASFYFYVRQDRPEQYKHAFYKLANQLELQDFYKLPHINNEQTRILSGFVSKTYEKCNQQLLDIAKENLSKSFTVVGLTERFNDTMTLLNKLFNWQLKPTDSLAQRKVNVNRPKLNTLSEGTLDALREAHKFELELYDFAKKLFEQQLKTELPEMTDTSMTQLNQS